MADTRLEPRAGAANTSLHSSRRNILKAAFALPMLTTSARAMLTINNAWARALEHLRAAEATYEPAGKAYNDAEAMFFDCLPEFPRLETYLGRGPEHLLQDFERDKQRWHRTEEELRER